MQLLTSDHSLSKYLNKGKMKVLKEFAFSFSHNMLLHRWKKIGHFSSHFHTSSIFLAYYITCYGSKLVNLCILSIGIISVCNESASDNLCKTKWRPNGHFCGNRYQGRQTQPPNLDRTAPGALTHPLTIHYISFIHFIYLRRVALQQVDFQGALR